MSNILVKCERVTVLYPKINEDRGFFYGQAKVQGSKASFKLQTWDKDVVTQLAGLMGNLEAKEEVNIIGTLKPTKHQVKEMSSGHMKQATDQNGNDIWTMAIEVKQMKLANPNAKPKSIAQVEKSLAPFGAPKPKKVIVEVKDDLQGITPNVEFDTPPSTKKKIEGIDYDDIPWDLENK